MKKSWYSRPTLSFFILAAISVILLFSASKIELGETNDSRYTIYSVIFEYYGMDSRQIENFITIPLEEKLMSLSQLVELRSTVEYGKTTTTAYFEKNVNTKTTYLNIRNAVQNLYETLPPDVQRPRIISSASDSKAVISISFSGSSVDGNMRTWIEQNLKKDFESIDGVSDVIIAGGKIDEIHISFDPIKIVQAGQSPMQLSTIVQDGNTTVPGAVLQGASQNQNIKFSTKLSTLEQIKNLPVKTDQSYSTLEYFAEVEKSNRLNNEIVRINGNECITVAILSSSNGNNIKISNECRRLLESKKEIEANWNILYDNGEELYKNIKKVFVALIESFIFIILIIPFFFNSVRSLSLTILFICLSCLWSVGILQLTGLTLNQNTLSGMAIAIGLIADTFFIINETAFSSLDKESFNSKVVRLIPSIISASLTTIITLIPLYFCDTIVPGIKTIAITIGTMIVSSTVLSIVFYPCFMEFSHNSKSIISKKLFKQVERFLIRSTYRSTDFSLNHRALSKIVYSAAFVVPIIIFIFIGKNLSFDHSTDVIYASIEFESDNHIYYIDSEIQNLIKTVSDYSEVKFIKSEAKKGTSSLEIGFDEKLTTKKELAAKIASLSDLVPNGFLYVPDNTNKKKETKTIEIAITGDDAEQCKAYAHDAVRLLGQNPIYENIVLNFKENEGLFEFIPSQEMLATNNITVEQTASILRWIMFGPVADKWLEDGHEMDIRVRGKDYQTPTLSQVQNLYIPVNGQGVRLNTLGQINRTTSNGKIYRKDSRHAAYFTIEASFASTDKIVADLKDELKQLPLKKGYAFSFSREIEMLSKQYRLLFFSLFISIAAVLILLTALTEDIRKSVLLISIIPVSFCIPLVIKLLFGISLELGDITGMVLLSGLSVNNTIYILESECKSIRYKIRNKVSSILVTSLTSIASALPLLFICKEGFSKNLSFFMVFGILSSALACFILFPAVTSCRPESRYHRM